MAFSYGGVAKLAADKRFRPGAERSEVCHGATPAPVTLDQHNRPGVYFYNMTTTRTLLSFALAGLVGCGGDVVLPAPSSEGAVLAIFDGNGQTGKAGEDLPEELVVSVLQGGAPLAGHAVAFTIVSAPAGVELEPDTAVTDEEGFASTQVMLGPEMGDYEIAATLVVADPAPTKVFEGSVVAGNPDTLRALSPVNQPGRREEEVEDAPTVLVLDRFGNPVAGAVVEWEVTTGGGQVNGAATADGNGQATATWILGDTRGAQKLAARVEGAHGSPLTFLALVLF